MLHTNTKLNGCLIILKNNFHAFSEATNADDTGSENQIPIELKVDEEDWDVDPATLIERGNRKGSRFSTDGTPLCLRSFLESGSPG